ncbi:helix-turn-helix domain-containing protein [Streptomyces microflavus]|uniref:AlbA family DNA-binding domain-containing protein n=1 Tax=Streptomyces microflavus TaxID=1919 RepID=UPI00381081DB
MALPARLAAALGRHPDDLTEDDLQRAVENHIPESVDLDWKKDFYKGTDAGKKELAKDVSAMANTAGGIVVIGVNDGEQDHAHNLAPFDPVQGHGEEWIRSVLANWVQPVVPNVGVRLVKSVAEAGKIYWVLTVPASTQAPHAVAAPGNDYHFRVHVRHGTTIRSLAESEIAQRYRDRFQAASDDADRLHHITDAGFDYLSGYLTSTARGTGPKTNDYPAWVSLAVVPSARGTHPVSTRADREAAFDRFVKLTDKCVSPNVQPGRPCWLAAANFASRAYRPASFTRTAASTRRCPSTSRATTPTMTVPSGCSNEDSNSTSWPWYRLPPPGVRKPEQPAT